MKNSLAPKLSKSIKTGDVICLGEHVLICGDSSKVDLSVHGNIDLILSTPIVGEPLTGCTESFIQIGSFSSKLEAENCLKYIKTKFLRAMLGTLKVTQDNPKNVWKNVPLQDFTNKSDIDWLKSVTEVDKQLYKKYKLDKDEIDFIESHVKEMK